jgi:hypothetical protein
MSSFMRTLLARANDEGYRAVLLDEAEDGHGGFIFSSRRVGGDASSNPLFFIASQGIVDLVRAAPEKVAAVVPHLVVPLRYALVTRRREVLVRVVEALKLIASCDAHLPGGGKAGRALVPFFRQLLPVINIFASRYRGLRGGIDGEARNRTSLEEVIQNLLNVLEVNGGPEAYLNIKYVVPQYTSVNLV